MTSDEAAGATDATGAHRRARAKVEIGAYMLILDAAGAGELEGAKANGGARADVGVGGRHGGVGCANDGGLIGAGGLIATDDVDRVPTTVTAGKAAALHGLHARLGKAAERAHGTAKALNLLRLNASVAGSGGRGDRRHGATHAAEAGEEGFLLEAELLELGLNGELLGDEVLRREGRRGDHAHGRGLLMLEAWRLVADGRTGDLGRRRARELVLHLGEKVVLEVEELRRHAHALLHLLQLLKLGELLLEQRVLSAESVSGNVFSDEDMADLLRLLSLLGGRRKGEAGVGIHAARDAGVEVGDGGRQ